MFMKDNEVTDFGFHMRNKETYHFWSKCWSLDFAILRGTFLHSHTREKGHTSKILSAYQFSSFDKPLQWHGSGVSSFVNVLW